MSDPADLERRLRVLEDLEAIKQMKYRYWRYLDLKQWDDMEGLFTEHATASYGSGKYSFQGRAAIMGFLRQALSVEGGSVTIHHGHHPEIEVLSATTAKGTWALYNYMYNLAHNVCIRIGAYYADEYVKLDGAWKLQHTGYRTLFHEEWKRDEIPSIHTVE